MNRDEPAQPREQRRHAFAPFPHAHPLVREFIGRVGEQQKSLKAIATEAGLDNSVIQRWRDRSGPNVVSLEAALNTIGYRLAIVPLDGAERRAP